MNRESGFYRVYIERWVISKSVGRWVIAEYNADSKIWNICGIQLEFSDYDFKEIDETPISPKP